jgi:ADP-ribosylglycohydrolase
MSYSSAVGCLVGLAVGDALGMPTEALGSEEFKKYFLPAYLEFKYRENLFQQDGQSGSLGWRYAECE